MAEAREESPVESTDWFVTTHWSVVRKAGDSVTSVAQAALEQLCATYWHPLYIYVRSKGHDTTDAQDLTQEFFTRLLERNDFAGLDPERGRFRGFLLAAMKHFLANEWRKQRTLKRGAGQVPFSLDTSLAEQLYRGQNTSESTPERMFDRRWAEMVLERAAKQLRAEFVQEGREPLFRELNRFLSVPPTAGDYVNAASRLGMTQPAVAKAVERMRQWTFVLPPGWPRRIFISCFTWPARSWLLAMPTPIARRALVSQN